MQEIQNQRRCLAVPGSLIVNYPLLWSGIYWKLWQLEKAVKHTQWYESMPLIHHQFINWTVRAAFISIRNMLLKYMQRKKYYDYIFDRWLIFCFSSYQYHHPIYNVPDIFEMGCFVNSYFQNFLHYVVEYEDAEDYLTSHDKIIPGVHVTDQPYCTNLIGCYRSTSSWKLNHQSEEKGQIVWWTAQGKIIKCAYYKWYLWCWFRTSTLWRWRGWHWHCM